MTVMQAAYLFDAERFCTEAAPLVQAADAGDAEPVRTRALTITDRLRQEGREWILEDPSSNPLLDIRRWPLPLAPDQVGYCFLVVLSRYLEPSPASLLGDWGILHAALTELGWSERDAILLTRGQNTEVLLRPGHVADPVLRPPLSADPANDDFAWWLRARNGHTGWLDTALVSRILAQLLPMRAALMRLDHRQLRRGTYPTVGPNTPPEGLLTAYGHAVTMLTAAAEENNGLFLVVS